MSNSCLIVGLGQIGMEYDFDLIDNSFIYTHARAISLHAGFRLIGAVDLSPSRRTRFEQRYGAPAFEQVESALKRLKPDIVVIATPSSSHGAIFKKIFPLYQPRLVMCEKPLDIKLDEARSMVDICKKEGIDLFVNYMRRADPGVIEIKRRINEEEIIAPVKVNAWYSKGILNNGSHFINLLEFWLGDIQAVTILGPGRLWDNEDPEPDVEVRFNLGTAVFRSGWEEDFSHYDLELLSRSGRLRYERGGGVIEWQNICADPNFGGYRTLVEKKENLTNGMSISQWHVYEQISTHLKGETNTLCTGNQALKTLEAIDLIIKQRAI